MIIKIEVPDKNPEREISNILLVNAWRYLDDTKQFYLVCDILRLDYYERLELNKLLTKMRIEKELSNNQKQNDIDVDVNSMLFNNHIADDSKKVSQ